MEWAWDLTDEDITLDKVMDELRGMGLVDGNGHTDADRVNHWASVQHLVGESDSWAKNTTEQKVERDASIARVVRVAAQLTERYEMMRYTDGVEILPYELAFEVAMVWEFG